MPALLRPAAVAVLVSAALLALAALPGAPSALLAAAGLLALNLRLLGERLAPPPPDPAPGPEGDGRAFLLRRQTLTGTAEGTTGFLVPGGYDVEDRRLYTGEDFRHIDWKASARRGTLMVKLSAPERGAVLWVLVDGSASCAGSKWDLFMRVCDALLSTAQFRYQSTAIAVCGDGTRVVLGPGSGTRFAESVRRQLSGFGPVFTDPEFAAVLDGLGPQLTSNSVVLLLSDFHSWSEEDVAAVQRLRARRVWVSAIKVSAPEEWDLPFRREVLVSDLETGAVSRVNLSDPLIRASYRYAVRTWHERAHRGLDSLMPLVECWTDRPDEVEESLQRLRQLLVERAGR